MKIEKLWNVKGGGFNFSFSIFYFQFKRALYYVGL